MAHTPPEHGKPERLYKRSYLQLIRNSVGSGMFRSFYVRTETDGVFDALNDGKDACAFYVSSVLVIFGAMAGVHGTVAGTLRALHDTDGWGNVPVSGMQLGDVLVWSPKGGEQAQLHIGFYVGDEQAVSNSTMERVVVRHNILFDGPDRPIEHVLRYTGWPQQPVS